MVPAEVERALAFADRDLRRDLARTLVPRVGDVLRRMLLRRGGEDALERSNHTVGAIAPDEDRRKQAQCDVARGLLGERVACSIVPEKPRSIRWSLSHRAINPRADASQADIHECQLEVNECQIEVNECQIEMNGCQIEMNESQIEINECQFEMNESQIEINECQFEMNESQIAMNECQIEIHECQFEMNECQIDLNESRAD